MSNANEPAFPETFTDETISVGGHHVYGDVYSSGGLTKREYFAAMAMQGILANPDARNTPENGTALADRIAATALMAADALLRALEKGEK